MRARSGFTLVETLVALTISSILVVLVGSVFLVQNRYSALQMRRVQVQDNARSATELVAREVRSSLNGSVTVAEPDRLVLRSPMVLVGVCAVLGPNTFVHIEGGADGVDVNEVRGVAVRTAPGVWSFHAARWSQINGAMGGAAPCAGNGADTLGASREYHRLTSLGTYIGSSPAVGDVLVLYRETEFRFRQSTLEPAVTALYRGMAGDTLVEFATGMDAGSGFSYRISGGAYNASVTGASLARIDAVRVTARGWLPPETGGQDPVRSGWDVTIPLGNVR
ncbi:MAG: prepilin-type N-terminal cleavage/methylation domain-containing protein [Gemmatimonadota bacterium]|nr:prepilin-type N-terminal cleavage/methylation domain-containing protein [Gemmatimonadota bacterium]